MTRYLEEPYDGLVKVVLNMVLWALVASAAGMLVNLVHPRGVTLFDLYDAECEEIRTVDVGEAKGLFDEGRYLFIDARNRLKYKQGHVAGAVNIPWGQLAKHYGEVAGALKERPGFVVYCDGSECMTSERLARKLIRKGFAEQDVCVFFDGWQAWVEAGYPVDPSP